MNKELAEKIETRLKSGKGFEEQPVSEKLVCSQCSKTTTLPNYPPYLKITDSGKICISCILKAVATLKGFAHIRMVDVDSVSQLLTSADPDTRIAAFAMIQCVTLPGDSSLVSAEWLDQIASSLSFEGATAKHALVRSAARCILVEATTNKRFFIEFLNRKYEEMSDETCRNSLLMVQEMLSLELTKSLVVSLRMTEQRLKVKLGLKTDESAPAHVQLKKEIDDEPGDPHVRDEILFQLMAFPMSELNKFIGFINATLEIQLPKKPKQEACQEIAEYLSHKGRATIFFYSLTVRQQKLLIETAWEKYWSTSKQLKKVLGFKITKKNDKLPWFSRLQLLDEFTPFLATNYYHADDCEVSLFKIWKVIFKPVIPLPKTATLMPVTLLENSESTISQVPEDFASLLPSLELLYYQGFITYTKQGKLTMAAKHKAKELLPGDKYEFYPAEKALSSVRLEYLLKILKYQTPPPNPRSDPEIVLRSWIDTFFACPAIAAKNIGIGKTKFYSSSLLADFINYTKPRVTTDLKADRKTLKDFRFFMKKLPLDAWISVPNILAWHEVHDKEPPLSSFFINSEVTTFNAVYGNLMRKPISETVVQLWERPVVRILLAVAASLGLLDIMYIYPEHPLRKGLGNGFLTPADGLAAVRLSKIGEWYFYNKKLPAAKEKQNTGTVTLDPNRLLLRLKGHNPILQMTLDRTADSLGNGLYRIDGASFLKDCTTQLNVESKVKALRTLLPHELPEIWRNFLETITSRINPVKKQNYTVLKIRETPELINAFVTDPSLQSLSLKAEKGLLLVRPNKMRKLKLRLQQLGFFIDNL